MRPSKSTILGNQALGLLLALAVMTQPLSADTVKFADAIRSYVYRPGVFADRLLGAGLPREPEVMEQALWYLRMSESARQAYGVKRLRRFIHRHRVPGLDFSRHVLLRNEQLELLLRPAAGADPAYKVRLLLLQATQADDRSMPAISRLQELWVLGVSAKITDQGMGSLSRLEQLRALSIPSPWVTDKGMPVLAKLTRLQRLNLQGTRVTDGSLTHLRSLGLRQVELGSTITDNGLKYLAEIPTLQQIDAHLSRVTAKGLSSLAPLAGIHTLLLGPSISDHDVPSLFVFKNLQRLDLTGASVSDTSLAVIGHMSRLEELALTRTQVSAAAWASLSVMPRLRYLEISGTAATLEAFKTVGKFPALQVLSFSSRRRLSREDLQPLARLPALRTLIINGRPLGRAFIDHLRQPAGGDTAGGNTLDKEFDEALEAVNAVSKLTDQTVRGFQGLRRIHEMEARLQEEIPAPGGADFLEAERS